MLVGGLWGVDDGTRVSCIEWCIGWGFGALQCWDDGSGVMGAVVEKEREGSDGVLGGGVKIDDGGECWGFVSKQVGKFEDG